MIIHKLGYICNSSLSSAITFLHLELIHGDLKSRRGRKFNEYLRKKSEVK